MKLNTEITKTVKAPVEMNPLHRLALLPSLPLCITQAVGSGFVSS